MVSVPAPLFVSETDSTNSWCRRQLDQLSDGFAVYTTCQTAGRGRRGRAWANAPGQGLYYTIVCKRPMADPAALPLAASLAAVHALEEQLGVCCQVKWPNDLVWQGKKLGGILCEAAQGAILCGIGINLMQDEAYFAQNGLVHGVSAAQILGRMPGADMPERLAQAMSEIFAEGLEDFYRQGFAAVREEYLSRCANLGRRVQFDGGEGRAVDVDETGCLVVDNGKGKQAVFTGEVTVQGIYGVK